MSAECVAYNPDITTAKMQKFFVAVVLVATLVLAEAARLPRADDKYTDKYDSVDVDEVIASDRLVDNYVKCLLEKGKCTPEAAELKEHLSDALQHECSKCTEKQRAGAEKVIKHLYKNKPDTWKQLSAKYDPENVYVTKYHDELTRLVSK